MGVGSNLLKAPDDPQIPENNAKIPGAHFAENYCPLAQAVDRRIELTSRLAQNRFTPTRWMYMASFNPIEISESVVKSCRKRAKNDLSSTLNRRDLAQNRPFSCKKTHAFQNSPGKLHRRTQSPFAQKNGLVGKIGLRNCAPGKSFGICNLRSNPPPGTGTVRLWGIWD
jgi:hypothetical protein